MTNQCNLIISELLCFVQCKLDVMDEVSLLQICESSFSDKEVDEARDILVQSSNLRTARKGDGKKKRVLQDILRVLKETDPGQLPVYVAKDLHRLPPVTFDHIDATTLLKDILLLKQDVNKIKSDYAKSTDIVNLQEKIDIIHTTAAQPQIISLPVIKNKNPKKKTNNSWKTNGFLPNLQTEKVGGENLQTYRPTPIPQNNRRVSANPHQEPPSTTNLAGNHLTQRTSSPINKSEIHNLDETHIDHSFTTVVNKKVKYRAIRKKNSNLQGKAKLTSTRIKVVPRLSFIYVSRFEEGTTEKDIEEFLLENGKTVVKVEKLTQFKKTDFSSFKITIEQTEEQSFLSEELWPAGIVYRRYKPKRLAPLPGTVATHRHEG